MHTRRQWLQHAGALAAALAAERIGAGETPARPRIAVIYTVLRFRSHAFNFLENCLRPLLFNGKLVAPPVQVASLFADQTLEEGDMTEDVSRRFKVPVFKTIEQALTLGGQQLAVDGVLLIGEHGAYPTNDLGQIEYPRKRFFDEIVQVMRRAGRFVPIFNDKHLSYRWDWARAMYDVCQENRIPFLAGSSVPLAQRRPALEIPAGAVIEDAVSVHGGAFEVYDFHGLEVLQSIAEFRKGGETGVQSVEFLTGDALWEAARKGRWSLPLAEQALRLEFGDNLPDLRQPLNGEPAHGILVSYRDGLRATVLKVGRNSNRWHFACKLAGEKQPRATSFYNGPWGNRCLFMALTHAIQHLCVRRETPYPIERTLVTTGMTEAAVHSRARGRRVVTPHLRIAYAARDFRAFRESGASWQVLTRDHIETKEIRDLPLGR
jgi:hypothetical protein